jgi:hypothetical protein
LLPWWLRSRGWQAKTRMRVVSPDTSSTAATDAVTTPLWALARACAIASAGAGVWEQDFAAAAARGRAEDGGAGFSLARAGRERGQSTLPLNS